MVLADLGAEVLRVDRPAAPAVTPPGPLDRGRRGVVLDLAAPDGVAAALGLAAAADVLVEGFRPGVMERLGLGPDVCLARNPRLVYGRVTGWGQEGPLARSAGHDLTYLALTGALAAIGPADGDPVPPLNLVADYGGGSMLLLVGLLAALVERGVSGRGQVVDAAMVDGATSMLALTYTLFGAGLWRLDRGANLLDGGAPYYATYRCSDGGHVAVAALEERFWRELVRVLDLDLAGLGRRDDPATWPELRARLAATFATRARDDWAELFAPLDACVAPVLTLAETLEHPQLGGRGTVRRSTIPGMAGATEPGPAPRFSRTPASAGAPPRPAGADSLAALVDWGLPEPTVRDLLTRGIAVQA
jgi:alpha-methylacyl-CoA racemase